MEVKLVDNSQSFLSIRFFSQHYGTSLCDTRSTYFPLVCLKWEVESWISKLCLLEFSLTLRLSLWLPLSILAGIVIHKNKRAFFLEQLKGT